ncbi:MAG: hypothetical protein JXA78_11290 [Anaerolineales bacterium]|nr:hypothetical protein [Anaerolineales bacterium]
MKTQRLIDLQYVLGLLLLPFLLLALAFLIQWAQELVRYEPAYFSAEYVQRYEVPNELLMDAETALRQGDASLMAQVQGTRQVPKAIERLPNVRFLIFWDRYGKYSDYLFMDTRNYHRYMQHIKLVRGRYVTVPEGLYYYLDSGNWVKVFGPLLAIWWLVVILFTLGVWIYRSMAAVRQEMYGPRPRLTK